MSKDCIEIRNVYKTFLRPDGNKINIFENLNLDIEKGKITCIIGGSGCGKTTLLNMIAGFQKFQNGSIILNDDNLNCKIGILFQDNVLYPWKTIMSNMLFACNNNLENPKKVVREYLKKTGLSNIENCYPNELSGGMQQRIALLRVLLTNPNLVILDEAFSALDFQTRKQMQDLFLDMHTERNFTAIVVTHDIMEAIKLGDNILIFYGSPLQYQLIENNVKCELNYTKIINDIENIFNNIKHMEDKNEKRIL